LVLSRKVGQRIVIAENIHITVLEIRGNIVRLGVTAPRDLLVHRMNAAHNRSGQLAPNLLTTAEPPLPSTVEHG
jgi:carbon storage regulator